MLTLEAAARSFQSLPRLVRAGAWVFALALLADVVLHVLGGDLADAHPEHTGPELLAHQAVFVGMVLLAAGVIREGIRQSAPSSRARAAAIGHHAEEQQDAVR